MYDEYMTPADRAARPPELQAVPARQDAAPCHYPSLAIVYAPVQEFTGLYSPAEGLVRGTLFAALDKPLMTGGSK